MLCSQVQLVKSGKDFDEILPLPCNCWSCAWCGPRRRRLLMALAASGEPTRMLTLTMTPERGKSPLHRRMMLHDAWKKLVKRILRHHKWKRLDYMAFVEKTKRGEPHLHILLRCGFISQKWISEQMRDMVGAPFVWISLIRGQEQAVRYVAKYVTKEPAQFGSLKRYWVSRWYPLSTPERIGAPVYDRMTMEMRRVSYAEVMQDRIRSGWVSEELETGWFRWWRPGHRVWADQERGTSGEK